MDVCPLWALVADVAADVAHTFLLATYNITQNVFLRDYPTVLLVRTQLTEQIIERLVAKRVIYETYLTSMWQIHANTRQPFPVAIVAQDGSHILTFLEALFNLFAVYYGETATQFLFADAKKLYGFKEIVAEPSIELALYDTDLFRALFGKRGDKVSVHHSSSIPYNIEEKHISDICHAV